MKTSRPISTISYNTPAFLISVLDRLILNRHISFYFFLYHFAESDESKDHIHLFLEPNGRICTDELSDLFLEMDLDHPDLPPLGVMPWRCSKFGDAYLYFLHDVSYLASKGQSREYHYSFDDIVSSNYDFLREQYHLIDFTKYIKSKDFVDRVISGASFHDMLQSGFIPIPQINAYSAAYNILRNGRSTHSPKSGFDVSEKES